MVNHYKILGVSETADTVDIKKAYKQLALYYHPDINGSHDATKRFIEIQTAYEVLTDPLKRAEHDHQLQQSRYNHQPQGSSPAPEKGFQINWRIVAIGVFLVTKLIGLMHDKHEGVPLNQHHNYQSQNYSWPDGQEPQHTLFLNQKPTSIYVDSGTAQQQSEGARPIREVGLGN